MIITAFATLWLRRFRRGPIELGWLWCFDRLDRAIPSRRTPARDRATAEVDTGRNQRRCRRRRRSWLNSLPCSPIGSWSNRRAGTMTGWSSPTGDPAKSSPSTRTAGTGWSPRWSRACRSASTGCRRPTPGRFQSGLAHARRPTGRSSAIRGLQRHRRDPVERDRGRRPRPRLRQQHRARIRRRFAPGFIYLVATDGAALRVADDLAFPNGMAMTADNTTLIVAESYAGVLTAYDIGEDGTPVRPPGLGRPRRCGPGRDLPGRRGRGVVCRGARPALRTRGRRWPGAADHHCRPRVLLLCPRRT